MSDEFSELTEEERAAVNELRERCRAVLATAPDVDTEYSLLRMLIASEFNMGTASSRL